MAEIRRSRALVLDPENGKPPSLGKDWTEDRPRQVHELALLGLTDEQMCKVLGITTTALYTWKENSMELFNALQEGKTIADAKVAAALYKRAVGYDVEEEHVSIYKGEPIITVITKHIAPDPWSAVKWLGTRQKSLWSETQRLDITNTNINIMKFDATGMSDDELGLMKKIGLRGQINDSLTSGNRHN